MSDPVKLDEPLHAFPLNDERLAIVGRITLMWGHIDSAIDLILDHIHRFQHGQFEVFVNNATVGTKIAILKKSVPYIKRQDARDAVEAAIAAVEPLLPDRNHITHGQWGWHWTPATNYLTPAASYERRKEQPFFARDLPKLHNKIAAAGHLVEAAFVAVWNHPDAGSYKGLTNRPYTFGAGGPPDLQKLHGEFWPPSQKASPDPH